MIARKLEEFGDIDLSREEIEKLRSIDAELLKKIQAWYEKQLITRILWEEDEKRSLKARGLWMGFVSAFEIISRLAAEPREKPSDALLEFYARASDGYSS